MNTTKGKSYNCPPKVFAVPANILALGGYGKIIVQSMYREYRSRIDWARTHRFRVRDK